MESPRTRYATTADGISIAYHAVGEGPRHLIYSPGWVTNIEVLWEWPGVARVFSRLAESFRVVLYDKRGTGLSDRVSSVPDLEARMDDLHAVIDSSGADRATLYGPTQGAAVNAMFAASFPERVDALVTYGGFARAAWAPDYPWGVTAEETRAWEERIVEGWGSLEWARFAAEQWGAGSLREDERFLEWLAKLMRFSATPTAAITFSRAFDETDIRDILPTIGVPTLLLHRANHGEADEIAATARLIPLAEALELPADHWSPYLGDPEPLVAAIEGFLATHHDHDVDLDRALATVLFTDIVGSTRTAAELGDRDWGELVSRHHAIVRALLGRYRGTEVDTAGDGFFATFDGPGRAVRCAQAIAQAVRALGIEIRAGAHTGEVGTIDGKAGGLAVTIGARVGALAGASEVLVSHTVKDLTAGSGLTFEDAGEHELKGVPDRWRLYRALD